MSRRGGASAPPDSLTRLRISSGAPHARHVSAVLSFMLWHHWHWIRSSGTAGFMEGHLRGHFSPELSWYQGRDQRGVQIVFEVAQTFRRTNLIEALVNFKR